MGNLLGCMNCGKSWSVPGDPTSSPRGFFWCPDCKRSDQLFPIGDVPGVVRPMVHVGFTPPQPLLLTYAPEQASPPPSPPQVMRAAAPVPPPRVAPGINVLPPGNVPIILPPIAPPAPPLPNAGQPAALTIHVRTTTKAPIPDTGPSTLGNLAKPDPALSDKTVHLAHTEGSLFQLTAKRIWSKYISDQDMTFYLNPAQYQAAHNRIYIRMICIYMIEYLPENLKIQVPAENNQGTIFRRNLRSTLERIAKGERIAKHLHNAAHNNEGELTSSKIKYERYGKNFKGARTGTAHLPAPPDTIRYHEFYVDRDGTQGASPLTIGSGSPGAERLWIAAPDWVFYTWNHYGSGIPFGPDRSALTDQDIWAVYSFAKKKWVLGLSRT